MLSKPARLRRTAVWALLSLMISSDCRHPAKAQRGCYYWRTTFRLSDTEKTLLSRHRVSRLYVRMFDIGWSDEAGRSVPVGRCEFSHAAPPGVEIVPVVFVRNEVFKRATSPRELAVNAWHLVTTISARAGFSYRELQVDCDWTEGTRESFFTFCRILKTQCGAAGAGLSATIRLHQVKYKERVGIPPVDRGMLMFYNVGKIAGQPGPMSIFNIQDAARYASHIDRYPLPLDGVLAIFSWAVHVRDGVVIGLIDKVDEESLDGCPVLRCLEAGRYTAVSPAYFHGTYLREGDTLALEVMTPSLARQAAHLLAEHFHPDGEFTLALFDLDERNARHYESQDLDDLFSSVR